MQSQKIRTLIVDDDFDARHLLKLSLGRSLEVVGETEHGAEAIRLASRLRPDLILLDVDLPDMSGLDVLRACRQALPDVVIVMVTGADDPEVTNEAFARGAASVVRKPYSAAKVQEAVAQALQRHLESVAPRRPDEEGPELGRLWSFCRATGGVGQTTLVLAHAQCLADQGAKVAVVDLDLMFGHVAEYLGMEARSPTLVDLYEGRELFRDEQIVSLLRTEARRVKVVCGPERMDLAYEVPVEMVIQVVQRLRRVCDHVLLDFPVGIPSAYLSLIEESTDLMLIAGSRPGSLSGLGRILEVFQELQAKGVQVRPVLHGWSGESAHLERFNALVEDASTASFHVLPGRSADVDGALTARQPVPLHSPESDYSAAVANLVKGLARRQPGPAPQKTTTGGASPKVGLRRRLGMA